MFRFYYFIHWTYTDIYHIVLHTYYDIISICFAKKRVHSTFNFRRILHVSYTYKCNIGAHSPLSSTIATMSNCYMPPQLSKYMAFICLATMGSTRWHQRFWHMNAASQNSSRLVADIHACAVTVCRCVNVCLFLSLSLISNCWHRSWAHPWDISKPLGRVLIFRTYNTLHTLQTSVFDGNYFIIFIMETVISRRYEERMINSNYNLNLFYLHSSL